MGFVIKGIIAILLFGFGIGSLTTSVHVTPKGSDPEKHYQELRKVQPGSLYVLPAGAKESSGELALLNGGLQSLALGVVLVVWAIGGLETVRFADEQVEGISSRPFISRNFRGVRGLLLGVSFSLWSLAFGELMISSTLDQQFRYVFWGSSWHSSSYDLAWPMSLIPVVLKLTVPSTIATIILGRLSRGGRSIVLGVIGIIGGTCLHILLAASGNNVLSMLALVAPPLLALLAATSD